MSKENNSEFLTPEGVKGVSSSRPENMDELLKEAEKRDAELSYKLTKDIPPKKPEVTEIPKKETIPETYPFPKKETGAKRKAI